MKVSILQGPSVLCADDAAIFILSSHTSDRCESKGRERKRVKLVESEQFWVSLGQGG